MVNRFSRGDWPGVFIIDEAHHLADKTQQHFTARTQLRGAVQWLDQMTDAVGTCAQRTPPNRTTRDVGADNALARSAGRGNSR